MTDLLEELREARKDVLVGETATGVKLCGIGQHTIERIIAALEAADRMACGICYESGMRGDCNPCPRFDFDRAMRGGD